MMPLFESRSGMKVHVLLYFTHDASVFDNI